MKIVIMFAAGLVGIAAGYYSGERAAKTHRISEIADFSKKSGTWTYFDFAENQESAEFLLATQCISGGTSDQTLYFITEMDEKSSPLITGGNYKVEGVDLPCGNWSIAAYAKKELIKRDGVKNFLTKSMVPVTDNKWEAYIATDKLGDNCISSGSGSDKMTVVLRIYNPAPELLERRAVIELPVITKI